MQKRIAIIIVFFTVLIFACKNDETTRQQATETAIEASSPEVLNSSGAEGKIALFSPAGIKLDSGKDVKLPQDDKETATIFLVQSAEKMEGKTSLTEAGLARAGYLAQMLEGAGLAQAYTDQDNASMQTATLSARSNQCELNFFKPENTAMMASTILANFKGKTVLVVGMPETLAAMLQFFTGNPKLRVAPGEHDNFFIVLANEPGKAQYTHAKY